LANHSRYRILAELGRGGMGVVYKAEQTLMDRIVAVKVISKALLDHPDALDRFRREVKAAARLSHPNIVIAHDAEQVGDLHTLVMEYVEGQSLDRVLQKKGPLPVAHACHFVRQAALGLQHAFEHGMVHRDIKPQNLMVTAKGQVKILDFGLAKVVSENAPQAALTATSAYMGTPDYSSPEQATDARSADIRADIYSLGCTLYCLLAGRPPFRAETAVLTILAHLDKPPQPLPELRPEVPAELWAVVAKMLAKDPAQRYQKPAEVAQALLPFCKAGTKPAPDTTPAATRAEQRTVPPPAKGGKPGVESPFEELTEKPVRPARPTAPAGKQPAPAKGPRWLLVGGAAAGVLVLALGAVVAGVLLSRGRTPALADSQRQTLPARLEPPAAAPATTQEPAAVTPAPDQPAVVAVPPAAVPTAPGPSGDGFVPLFNGRNLDGWSVDGLDPRSWTVEDGAIVARGTDQRARNYLLSNLDYGDFILRLEYNLEPGADGAVTVRARRGENLPLGNGRIFDHPLFKLVAAPSGVETGMTFWVVDRTRVKPDRPADQTPTGTWNRLEIEVRGHTLRASVNDKPVLETSLGSDARFIDGTIPALNRRKGRVGFQKHTGTERFRNIEIKELAPGRPDGPSPRRPPAAVTTLPPAEGFVPLFNGKDLSGWKVLGGGAGEWRVEDGAIVSAGPHSYLFSEQGNFRNVHLRAEAMINDGGNSGLFFRAPYMPGLPKGYEAQIDSTHRDPVKTGSLHPHFHPQLPPEESAKVSVYDMLVRPNQWFALEVIAFGDHIVIKVNGRTTVDYVDPYSSYAVGHVALQQLEPATVVKVRKLEVKELDSDLTAPASEADPAREDLDKAWAAYVATMGEYREAVAKLFDKREEEARMTGKKVQVDQIKAEREAFEKHDERPPGLAEEPRQKRSAARSALEAALQAAIKEYVKAKQDRQATALENEWRALRREDLFPTGKYRVSYRQNGQVVPAVVELRVDHSFHRVYRGNVHSDGGSDFNGSALVLRCKDFVEVWTPTGGRVTVEWWGPPANYPNRKPQVLGDVRHVRN
jgi:hypothetical protein